LKFVGRKQLVLKALQPPPHLLLIFIELWCSDRYEIVYSQKIALVSDPSNPPRTEMSEGVRRIVPAFVATGEQVILAPLVRIVYLISSIWLRSLGTEKASILIASFSGATPRGTEGVQGRLK
jgi:hypothetical protein